MSFHGFGKSSGPGAPPTAPNPFANLFPRSSPPPPSASAPSLSTSPSPTQPLFSAPPFQPSFRPVEASGKWGDGNTTLSKVSNAQTNQRPSPASPFVGLHSGGNGIPSKGSHFQDQKRNRSLPSPFSDEGSLRNSNAVIGRPHSTSPVWANQNKLGNHFTDLRNQHEQPTSSLIVDSYDIGRISSTGQNDVQVPKRTRSPPVQYASEASPENSLVPRSESKRLSARSTDQLNTPDSGTYGSFMPSAHVINVEATATKPINSSIPKRSRSPPSTSLDKSFMGNSDIAQDDTERELQAKAKRLARFKDELSQPEPSTFVIGNQKVPLKGHEQSIVEKRKLIGEPLDGTVDYPSANISSDYEGPDSSSIIIGLCPEMCPELERAERERKGDLDRFERLDGDRNQTSKSLAVKKYTRTAEREANLIRPLPVLQKTMQYLLELLDQPYDAEFLGLYNFLWDRMRAIRMDLRMQHIFNLEAITMLEQMIRLHILAMHELCEYTKGEGFSEGFDAHLNIEQMNKTSVELFQLYDDHRKNGIDVPTEKEFRGYYALLKLDKHPGYKVEPAELSLDLAKMTSEVRQAPEVLFARDVARSCRSGNFIAFFRLVRKASYLQACLMHAHFTKLRSQALASLHSGLQNNQGIPVAHVAKWLGMEEEDIEDLLDYHGFSIKEFEEPYMVKEGPFLNNDNSMILKCSKLVHSKKSGTMFEDVSSPCLMKPFSSRESNEIRFNKVYEQEQKPVEHHTPDSSLAIEEEMVDSEPVSTPKLEMQVHPTFKASVVNQQSGDYLMVASSPLPGDSESLEHRVSGAGTMNFKFNFRNSLEKNKLSDVKPMPPVDIMPRSVEVEKFPVPQMDSTEGNIVHSSVSVDVDNEEDTIINDKLEKDEVCKDDQDEEIALAKLKLILRKWRRHSFQIKELRERKQLAANAALSSLSLGPPILQYQERGSTSSGEFNMHRVMMERHDKQERSWSKLNVSDVIVGELSERNAGSNCICWKAALCSQIDNPYADKKGQKSQVSGLAVGSWLYSKIMPNEDCQRDDLIVSLDGLSIWKTWVHEISSGEQACCLSVIKDVKHDNPEKSLAGASAVMFLVYECIPLKLQKLRLHNLVMSISPGCCLPLLVLSGSSSNYSGPSSLADGLGLSGIDKSRISSFLIVFLLDNQQTKHLDGFYSDELLREGLQWLASKSPSQPVLHQVKTRDLVFSHLNPLLGMLNEFNANNAYLVHCISAYNEALNRSIEEVTAAANTNSSCWPCPEIALLNEYSDERRAVDRYLPTVGWSSAGAIEPLTRALNHCKLPTFPDDISWLLRGSDIGKDMEIHRAGLEDSLTRYLTETSRIMGWSLAKQETCLMLQKWARLELHESTYYIVPNWLMIFRRVFNWQLMNLCNGELSTVYVLKQNNTAIATSRDLDDLQNEREISPFYLVQPCLDEMLQVGCSSLNYSENEPFRPVQMMVNQNRGLRATDESEVAKSEVIFPDNSNESDLNNDCNTSRFKDSSREAVVVDEVRTEADRLSELLEKCNMVQNMIDQKLSIYF